MTYIVIHKEDTPLVTGPIKTALDRVNNRVDAVHRFVYLCGYDASGLSDRFLQARKLIEDNSAERIICILDVMHGPNQRDAGISDLVGIGEAMNRNPFYRENIYEIGFLTSVPNSPRVDTRVARFDPKVPVYVWEKDSLPRMLGTQVLSILEDEVLSTDPTKRMRNIANKWRP